MVYFNLMVYVCVYVREFVYVFEMLYVHCVWTDDFNYWNRFWLNWDTHTNKKENVDDEDVKHWKMDAISIKWPVITTVALQLCNLYIMYCMYKVV